MRLAGALARIVTEAEEDDPRTPVRISGIPLPLDPAIASDVLLGDDGIRSLAASGLCVPDAPVRDHGNLTFFANMLRLHLVVSSDQWYLEMSTSLRLSTPQFISPCDQFKWSRTVFAPGQRIVLKRRTRIVRWRF